MISVLSKHAGYGPDGRRRMFFDLGGDSPPPPDYTPLAQASEQSAQIMAELGDRQLTETRRQYDLNREALAPILDTQKAIMRQSKDQGDDYYDYLKTTFRPVEEGLARDATEFSTEGAREGFARTAVSDLEQAQANERAQADRAMMAAGVNPNSGRFAGMNRAGAITNAAARAGAATGAREKADAMGWAKRMDVTGLGRNLPGASSSAYQVASGAGNSATGTQMAPSNQLLSGMQGAAGLTQAGLGMQMQGLTSIAGLQSQNYNAALNQDSGLGSFLGMVGGIAGKAMFSSKKYKKGGTPVDEGAVLEAVGDMPNVEEWDYKPGVADGGHHIGAYAEDVHEKFGESAAPGGDKIDIPSAIGINLAATKALLKRLEG
ncbi:MAG: hypothetical protein E6Q97_22875, partial [Desulfurellales bacterium]